MSPQTVFLQTSFYDLVGDNDDESSPPLLDKVPSLDEVRQQVIEQLPGANPETVRIMRDDWAELMQQGVIVSLHIGRWRARTRQELEDLGLQVTPEIRELLQNYMPLGEKLLLPAWVVRKLRTIEACARDWLRYMSYDLPWGHFVPYTAYGRWRRRNEEYRRQYFEIRDLITTNIDNLLHQVRSDYTRLAAEAAWQRIAAETTACPPWFVERFLDRVLSKIPSVEEIRDSFHYSWYLTYMPLPSILEADRLRTERLREEAMLEQERRNVERARLDAEANAARRAAQEHQRRLEAMYRDVEAQKQEQIDSFLLEITCQLRELVYEASSNILDSISRNNGRLVGRSAEAVRNLVEHIQAMNFTGDADIERHIEELRSLMERPAELRNPRSVERALQALQSESQAVLLSLGRDLPRRQRAATDKTGDIVISIEERRRRRTAGAEALTELPAIQRRRR